MQNYKIAIVGAGIAGLATAILLSRTGHKVELFTTRQQPQDAATFLPPVAVAIMRQLGVLDDIKPYAAEIQNIQLTTDQSRLLIDINYAQLKNTSFGLGLSQQYLQEILIKAVRAAGGRLTQGKEIVGVEHEQHGDYRLIASDDSRYERYAAVIVANGASSKLRDSLNLKHYCRRPFNGMLWSIVPDAQGAFQYQLMQRYPKSSSVIGVLPLGKKLGAQSQSVCLFAGLAKLTYAQWCQTDIAAWKRQLLDCWPELSPLLKAIVSHEAVNFCHHQEVIMSQWHDNKIVCIGDAGHAMSPLLGQNTSMALLDALVLNKCINQSINLVEALMQYNQLRSSQLRYYQYVNRLVMPFFQTSNAAMAAIRNKTLLSFANNAAFCRAMLRTVAGLKAGVLMDEDIIDL